MEQLSAIDPTQQALSIISSCAPEMLPTRSTKDLYSPAVNAQLSAELSAVHVLPKVLGKKALLPAIWLRYTKDEFMNVIEECNGILGNVCYHLDCTPRQFYTAIDHYELRDFLHQCKKNLVSVAENAILECLHSQNETIKLRAAEITVKSLGRDEWSTDPSTVIQQAVISDSEKKIQIQNIFGIKEAEESKIST